MEKKLEYIVNNLITPFIKEKYPAWEKFIGSYLKYLDSEIFKKTINITDNNNPYEIYPELLNDYLDTYFKGIINTDIYNLTDENKRIYLSLSKFISGLKGNKNAFEFLFKTLTNFSFNSVDGVIDIDKIDIQYNEDEDWWEKGDIRYYNGIFYYDGVEVYNSDFGEPYTYKFLINQSYTVVKDLIQSVHPAGFLFEILSYFSMNDTISMEDTIIMTQRIIPKYRDDQTKIYYDGSITYGGYVQNTYTF